MDLKLKKGTQIPKPGDPFENSGIVVAEATQRLVTTRGEGEAGVNICPKKSETVYSPIWGILKQSVLLNKKIQCLHNKKFPSGLLKYVVIGGKKAFRAESGLIRDLFWTR